MKKIFTLVCACCAVFSAFAEKSIKDVATWSPWSAEMTVDATADGTSFTASEAWKGAGFWVASAADSATKTPAKGADWSDYDYLVYKVKDCSGNFNLSIEYTTNVIDSTGNLVLVKDLTSGSLSVGKTYAGMKLHEDYSDRVAQTWIQSTVASSSVIVTDLVLMTEDEFQELKESEKSAETILWQGTLSFDNTWPGVSGIGAALFADAKVGDKIVVTVSSIDDVSGWEYGAQLLWKNGSWQTLAGTTTTSVAAAGEVELVLNDSALADVQANGFVLQGMACTVTKIVLRAAGAASDTQIAWEGENVIGNYDGSFFISADKFVGLQAGCKLIIDFKEDTESATYWQFKLNRGDTWADSTVLTSNSADLNDWKYATMSQGQEKYSFALNQDDVTAILAGGLRIQGYYVTVTKVSFSKATAIDTPVVERQDDGIMYNIIGQPVGEGYKGLVICNGKKFILK